MVAVSENRAAEFESKSSGTTGTFTLHREVVAKLLKRQARAFSVLYVPPGQSVKVGDLVLIRSVLDDAHHPVDMAVGLVKGLADTTLEERQRMLHLVEAEGYHSIDQWLNVLTALRGGAWEGRVLRLQVDIVDLHPLLRKQDWIVEGSMNPALEDKLMKKDVIKV